MTRKNLIEKSSRNGRAEQPRKPATFFVFGMCRLGFIIAVVAHLLLFSGALTMLLGYGELGHVLSLFGYGLLSGLLLNKSAMLFRRKGKKKVTIRLRPNKKG